MTIKLFRFQSRKTIPGTETKHSGRTAIPMAENTRRTPAPAQTDRPGEPKPCRNTGLRLRTAFQWPRFHFRNAIPIPANRPPHTCPRRTDRHGEPNPGWQPASGFGQRFGCPASAFETPYRVREHPPRRKTAPHRGRRFNGSISNPATPYGVRTKCHTIAGKLATHCGRRLNAPRFHPRNAVRSRETKPKSPHRPDS